MARARKSALPTDFYRRIFQMNLFFLFVRYANVPIDVKTLNDWTYKWISDNKMQVCRCRLSDVPCVSLHSSEMRTATRRGQFAHYTRIAHT